MSLQNDNNLLQQWFQCLASFGLLRIKLYTLALIVIVFTPVAGTPADYQWPGIVESVVLPALAPIVFMVILFDTVMSKVVASGADDEQRIRANNICFTGLGLGLIILFRWLPYLLTLGG